MNEMFQERDQLKENHLERLHSALSFEEILEMSDLTEEEVVEILYDTGYLKLPPFILDNEDGEEAESGS